jgi:hypothetical protein
VGTDLPLEKRRELWGWFGQPWPSEVCYDGDQLREDRRKPFPAGESCGMCCEVFDEAAGDRGQAIPDSTGTIGHVHIECLVLEVLGPQGPPPAEADPTRRARAMASWEWVQAHGSPPL